MHEKVLQILKFLYYLWILLDMYYLGLHWRLGCKASFVNPTISRNWGCSPSIINDVLINAWLNTHRLPHTSCSWNGMRLTWLSLCLFLRRQNVWHTLLRNTSLFECYLSFPLWCSCSRLLLWEFNVFLRSSLVYHKFEPFGIICLAILNRMMTNLMLQFFIDTMSWMLLGNAIGLF